MKIKNNPTIYIHPFVLQGLRIETETNQIQPLTQKDKEK